MYDVFICIGIYRKDVSLYRYAMYAVSAVSVWIGKYCMYQCILSAIAPFTTTEISVMSASQYGYFDIVGIT